MAPRINRSHIEVFIIDICIVRIDEMELNIKNGLGICFDTKWSRSYTYIQAIIRDGVG